MKISKQKYSLLQLLKNKKYRYKTGLFILEGEKIIKDAVKFRADFLFVAYSPKFIKSQQEQEFLNHLKNKKIEIYEIDDADIEKVSELETSQGIIAVAKMFEFSKNDIINKLQKLKKATVIALDRISDPGNLGTIFRICDWFKVDAILISEMSVDIFNPKTLRASSGSTFNVHFLKDIALKDELTKLKSFGFKIFSTAPTGKIDYHKVLTEDKIVLIFGSEAHGVDPELVKISDGTIKIKKFGQAESLNVAISAGIILSERAYSIYER
jgi:TrmH family RNA methyltransferase